jgi:hypothetical protein
MLKDVQGLTNEMRSQMLRTEAKKLNSPTEEQVEEFLWEHDMPNFYDGS